ncbi:hypothetical protein FOQG_02717 [Fusarium oxysporum f. sp. raphani 54005]|uniref:Uncharacterized protein n=4 Tax=Fusarium oxysporum TaxID=5507 RepID=W9J3G5_FUSOX|nr:hypothetical protein FOYG_01291 [Fusarium oxysporum NRRL 32931]EWZ47861.1 hypothetical protein FOZG_03625 [Fusarium oxysporum Fo47]EWZ92911.1 hypothetical protein FOWG_05864 [Fusarium oxysporum f. sp. lycopersici MN25]EXK45180.1 hypothetical protein FOMG_03701 [Fusarium oxysporum f. sp. melonis 26406]EXK97559.1 hypothetical protein FOQG_02717 [Fusarium oxysporum f. sp. raphani 54005]EXL53192.1 hypothetical protein FOCG_06565 [Fusarium oxysporum f. sp. radicis-lycopersici 26381]
MSVNFSNPSLHFMLLTSRSASTERRASGKLLSFSVEVDFAI